MTDDSTDEPWRKTVGLLVGFILLSTAAAAYEIALASVLPVVQKSLGLGTGAAGSLVSVMYATAVVTSIPLASRPIASRYAKQRIGTLVLRLVLARCP